MKLIVNPHKIEIKKELVNEKEINITKCEFEFAEEITDDYVKEAYFTLNNNTYKQVIFNNECDIPGEVLEKKGTIEIGVVAYLVENEVEIKRYNPSPVYISTLDGSLKSAENSEPITPSEMEQFEQELQDGLNELAEAVEGVERLDIDAEKVDHTTTITITKKDGSTKEVEVLDGEKGEQGEQGEKGDDGYTPVKGVDYFTPEDIASLNIPTKTSDLTNNSGFIDNSVNDLVNYYDKTNIYNKTEIDNKISSVYKYKGSVATYQDLPSTDLTIGDVYNVESDGSNYAWNGIDWDRLGGEVDLSNYYNKTQTDTLLSGKVDNSTLNNYYDKTRTDELLGAKYSKPVTGIPKTDLESAVQTSLGKADTALQSADLTNYVKNTDYATSSVGGVIKIDQNYGLRVSSGTLVGYGVNYTDYGNALNQLVIDKGTLENVIAGKDLTTKAYVDGLVGDIATALDNIQGEVI